MITFLFEFKKGILKRQIEKKKLPWLGLEPTNLEYFVRLLVQMKTVEFAFEINWPWPISIFPKIYMHFNSIIPSLWFISQGFFFGEIVISCSKFPFKLLNTVVWARINVIRIEVSFLLQCSKMQSIPLKKLNIQTFFFQFLWFFRLKCSFK